MPYDFDFAVAIQLSLFLFNFLLFLTLFGPSGYHFAILLAASLSADLRCFFLASFYRFSSSLAAREHCPSDEVHLLRCGHLRFRLAGEPVTFFLDQEVLRSSELVAFIRIFFDLNFDGFSFFGRFLWCHFHY